MCLNEGVRRGMRSARGDLNGIYSCLSWFSCLTDSPDNTALLMDPGLSPGHGGSGSISQLAPTRCRTEAPSVRALYKVHLWVAGLIGRGTELLTTTAQ